MPSAMDQYEEIRQKAADFLDRFKDKKTFIPIAELRANGVAESLQDLALGKYLLGLEKHADQPPLHTQGPKKIFYEILMEGLDTCIYAMEGIEACEEEERKGKWRPSPPPPFNPPTASGKGDDVIVDLQTGEVRPRA